MGCKLLVMLNDPCPLHGPSQHASSERPTSCNTRENPNCAMIFQRPLATLVGSHIHIMQWEQWVHISAMLSIFWAMQKASAKVWSHDFIDFSRLQAHRTIAPMDVRVTQTPALARRWIKYTIWLYNILYMYHIYVSYMHIYIYKLEWYFNILF